MKRSQGPSCQRAEKREVEQIDVKMKNVELLRALAHLINHQHEVRNDVAHGRIKAQRTSATGSQLGAGDGVPARKERHIVAKPDKFFGQVGNDPLSAAIETRRNALNERSDLCDLHDGVEKSGPTLDHFLAPGPDPLPGYEPTSIFRSCRPPGTLLPTGSTEDLGYIAVFGQPFAQVTPVSTTMGMPRIKNNRGNSLLCRHPGVTGRIDRDCV